MTQEEKQLLLKDLCARLPYGVIAHVFEINKNGTITDVNIPYNMVNLTIDNSSGKYELVPLFDIKPYLRPMSSMTKEEKDYLYNNFGWTIDDFTSPRIEALDYMFSYHLDFRGLIEKGLALEAPEGMYKTE